MFQTASLFSIEVDYYNFGTCEIEGGSYFCGDHSCNTFKHVGDKFKGIGGSQTVYEQHPNTAFISSSNPGNYPLTNENGVPAGTLSSGTHYNDFGNTLRSSSHAHTLSNYVQEDTHGYPLRGDALVAQYQIHSGKKATGAGLESALPVGMSYQMVQWHTKETLVAGMCKAKCDSDITCKVFQENRWEHYKTAIKCTTFHFDTWPHDEANFASTALSDSDTWDAYFKYTQNKKRTWLHSPIHTAFSPTTSGGGAGAPFLNTGRRLEGVY